MIHTLYLDETLTGFEREIAIESAKMDISMQKLDALYEAVDANLQANYKEAELKVYAENGTYDDLAMLYMEAENDAAEKKGGILLSLFNAIVSFCSSIINGIKNIFKKSSENKSVPKDTVLEVESEDSKKLDAASNVVGRSTGFLNGIKSATKDGCNDFVKFVKDNIGFFVVTGTAATGAVAGTSRLITKKITKASFEKKIADVTDQLDKLKAAVIAGKVAVKAGEIFIGSDEDSGEQKPAEQPAAATDGKKSDAAPAGQATPSATQTSDGKSDDGKKKGSKIIDAVKSALKWIGEGIKRIGEFITGIWNKYIGSLFRKNKNTETKEGSGTAEGTPDEKSGETDEKKDDNGSPAPKSQLSADSSEEPETIKLSDADIEKLVHKFDSKLKAKKERGKKINKFVRLLRNSTNWKTDTAVQKYLSDYKITLESVYDLFENAIVADHFMTFYAEACDDYDYSIDNIFDSI